MGDFSQVAPYVSLAFLVVLGLFVLFGILFGLGRGLKRSSIRLLTVLGFMLLAFFFTPLTADWVFGWNISLGGNTPKEWVDELVQYLQDSNTVEYLAPVIPYVGEFAVALALALVNMVLFLVLYLVLKPLSWIVYTIIAHHAAPKKDADGNKVKKHAWAGGLVGLVQGLVLFFFFMLPFNGILGVVNQVATYEPVNSDQTVQTQSVNDAESSNPDDYDVIAIAQQVDSATTVYTNILRYTGMEFLTKQAFRYETMVRLSDGTQIQIRDDLATAIELTSDLMAFNGVVKRVNDVETATDDMWLALQEIKPADYAAARKIVDKFFTLNILKIGDVIIGDLDKIMAENFGEEGVYLENSQIIRDSAYGVITEMCADEQHRDQFLTGLKAMVGYIADQKFELVHQDIIDTLNLLEKLYSLTITTPDGEQPLMVAITRPNTPVPDEIDRLLATVGENGQNIDPDATAIDVLFDSYLSLASVQMLGAKGAENFIYYSNFFDNITNDNLVGLPEFVRTFTSGFFGEGALTNNADLKQAGHWYKLKDVVKSVLSVVRDHYHISDELNRITDELRAAQPDASEDALNLQAIVRYVAELSDEEIDNLAIGLHRAVFAFTEVTDFLNDQVPNLPLGDFKDLFGTLLATDDLAVWQSTLKGLKNTMVMLDKASAVIQDITNLVNNGENTVEDILQAVVGDGTAENPGLNSAEVADLVYEVLQIESVGAKLDDVLQNLDLGDYAQDTAVQQTVNDLKQFLNDFNAPDKTPEQIAQQQAQLQQIFGDIWDSLRNYTPPAAEPEGQAA